MLNIKDIQLSVNKNFNNNDVLEIYKLNKWSSANKPSLLIKGLKNSHTLILAYYMDKLLGLGSAISDGHLVVYYPHLLIHPKYQGQGIGKLIMTKFQEIYGGFHQQMLTADANAVEFYKNCGFERAGQTEPMWIYKGEEH